MSETIPVTNEPPAKDDLQSEFEGDVKVTDKLPTQDDLKKCEDLVVLDSKGASRTFKSLYTADNTAPRQLIIFIRHFFCGICQEFIRTLCSSITPDNLLTLEKPTFITIIGCGRPELIDMYVQTTECGFPIYADPTRKLYEHLGMVRTLKLGKERPDYMQTNMMENSIRSIFQALKSGKDALNGGDMKQIGGEFLFEDGNITWCHRMRNTRDHAEVTDIRRLVGLDSAKPPLRKTWSSGIKAFSRRSSSWGRPAKEEKEKSKSDDVKLPDDKSISEIPTPLENTGEPAVVTPSNATTSDTVTADPDAAKGEAEASKQSLQANGTAKQDIAGPEERVGAVANSSVEPQKPSHSSSNQA